MGRWPELPQAGDKPVPAITATDPSQGTAELISHVWGIHGKVQVRKGRKYHTGRGEGNKMSETTEGLSKAWRSFSMTEKIFLGRI